MTKDTIDTLVTLVQDALEANLTTKSSVKDESLDKRLWNAMHELWDMED